PRQHRHWHELARRTVLAGFNTGCATATALPPAIHAHTQHRAAGWPAVYGDRYARRRQSGSNDPSGVPERCRVLERLVPQPARSIRVAPGADATLLWFLLAAQRGIQSLERRSSRLR